MISYPSHAGVGWRRPVMGALALLAVLIGPARAASGGSTAGKPSIGDPYYPTLGNGGYHARHYTLDLAVDVRHNTITGTVTIEAQATQDLTRFSLDLVGFTVGAVTVDGRQAAYSRPPRKLVIAPAAPLHAGHTFRVAIAYRGVPTIIPTPSGDGGWHDDGQAIYVTSEPDGAEGWYPVDDHPLDKATYSFRLTVPVPYVAVANGLPRGIVRHGATTSYLWQTRFPMASYLATVAIARFTLLRDSGPHGLPLLTYVPPPLAALARDRLKDVPRMLAYFESIVGPYPFESYGAVLAEANFRWALETQTRSLFSQSIVAMNPDVDQEGISHELAHQWFGDSVSLKTWRDIWLNEGFATYMSWLWLEHIHDRAYLEDIMRRHYNSYIVAVPYLENLLQHPRLSGQTVLHLLQTIVALEGQPMSQATILSGMGASAVDQVTSGRALGFLGVHPGSVDARLVHELVRSPAPALPPHDDLFAQSVYLRGAMTLQALRLRVGDATFFRILRTYATRYRYGNAATGDFIAVAQQVSGQRLAAFFDRWLYARTAPPLPALLPTQ